MAGKSKKSSFQSINISSGSSGSLRNTEDEEPPAKTNNASNTEERKKRRKKLLMAASIEDTCRIQGYNLIKVVGHGSYGSVFLCRSRRNSNGESCAVKVIDTTKAEKIFVEKFLQREIEILLIVKHPFIVHTKSIVFRNQKYYIFMRYAEKGDLFDLISKAGRLEVERARIWSAQLASALHYLHSIFIVHRDIKCENILISRHYNVYISDFGFARQITIRNGKAQDLTTFCGTKHYASPEIISSKPYDPIKGDVWAFGVVLFIMLTGTMPFLANNQKKIREHQLKESWKSKVNLPEEIMTIFRNVFMLDQAKRWDSVQLKDTEWYRMGSQYPKASRNIPPQSGSDEFIKRIYLLKRNQQVYLPSLTDNERSKETQSPSFMAPSNDNEKMDMNELVQCPFQQSHLVSRRKLQYHIVSCVKSYKAGKVREWQRTFDKCTDKCSHPSTFTARTVSCQQSWRPLASTADCKVPDGRKVPCPYNALEYFYPEEFEEHFKYCTSKGNTDAQYLSLAPERTEAAHKRMPAAPFHHHELPQPTESWGLE